jgi:anti-sigma B factor antagonist
MTLSHQVSNGVEESVIWLEGRIDRDALTTLEQAYRAAAASNPRTVLLEFSRVDYINSTGIALIVELLARARADARTVRARGLSDHYRHIFDITRLTDYIEIVQTAEEPV